MDGWTYAMAAAVLHLVTIVEPADVGAWVGQNSAFKS